MSDRIYPPESRAWYLVACAKCDGTGYATGYSLGYFSDMVSCDKCNGIGRVARSPYDNASAVAIEEVEP